MVELEQERVTMAEEITQARATLLSIDRAIADRVEQTRDQERAVNTAVLARLEGLERELAAMRDLQDRLVSEKKDLERLNLELARRVQDREGREVDLRSLAETLRDRSDQMAAVTHEFNLVQERLENVSAENQVLRRLAGVPDNYGFDVEVIKRGEQQQLTDFKHQLRVRELEIQELEAERTQLRYRLREMTSTSAKTFF